MAEIRWKARSFVDADFEKAANLRKDFFMNEQGSQRRSCEPTYYRWKILSNPVGAGLFHVADDDGQVVGITTVTSKRLHVRSKDIDGAEIGDTFTHPRYQRQGMFTALVNLTREKALDSGLKFIYGTPNDQSLPGYEKKLNFGQIPGAHVYNYVRPVNVSSVLALLTGYPVLARALGPLFSAGFEALFRFRLPRLKGVTIACHNTFPEDVEQLWGDVSCKYDWILKRDKKYLDWRFIRNADDYLICIARREGNTVGYLVAKLGQFGDLTVGYLADFLVKEECPNIFAALVTSAANSFQTVGVDMFSAWVVRGSIYQKVLARFGFLRYKPVPIICYKNELGLEIINGQNRWHFTIGDSDNI